MDPATSTPTRAQLWALADTVRRKLLDESSKPDPPLRVLVGHANMLDRLIAEICKHDAEDSVGELDFGTGTVEAVALSTTDSDSDCSTDSASETESEDSDSSDDGGVECSRSGCCQPEPIPEGRDEWLGTGSAEAQEDHWTPSVPRRLPYRTPKPVASVEFPPGPALGEFKTRLKTSYSREALYPFYGDGEIAKFPMAKVSEACDMWPGERLV